MATVAERDGLDIEVDPDSVHLERPARRDHGDWSTNIALNAAKRAGQNPRDLAAALVEALRPDPPAHATSIEVAGPGFINFHLDDGWLYDALAELLDQGEGGLRPPRRRARRTGAGRVHIGQSDRPDPCGQRLVGELRRRPGPGAGPGRLPGQSRVLRQRHRRTDPHPGGEPSGPPARPRRCPRAATRAST